LDEADPQVAYRLIPSSDGYTLKLDSPSEDDRMLETEDQGLILVHPVVFGGLHHGREIFRPPVVQGGAEI
jgi:hypothetical protein